MKVADLTIKNFLTISNASVALKDRGLHLIQGVNDDDGSASSNGAGKSSVVDAICWCLFGVTARGVKGDAVVNQKAKKDCFVGITLENAAAAYRVVRYRKNKDQKNLLTVTETSTAGTVNLTKGTEAETQKEVERILGCSYEVFMAAVYSGQEVMPDLPRMGDRDLKRLIEEAAGLQRIEAAYALARERSNEAARARDKLLDMERVEDSRIHALEKRIADSKKFESAWEAAREDRVASAATSVTGLIADAKNIATWLVAEQSKFEASKFQIGQIDIKLADHSKLQKAAELARATYDRADRAIDRSGLAALTKERGRCEDAIDNAHAEMKKPCPECGKPHTEEELVQFREHLAKKLLDVIAKQKEKAAEVERQAAVAAEAKDAYETLRAAVPDVSELMVQRKELADRVNEYTMLQDRLEKRKMALKTAQAEVVRVKEEKSPHHIATLTLEQQLADAVSERAVITTKRQEASKAWEVASAVVKVFGPAGVRAQILDTVTPFLNHRTADYLSVLSDGNIHATWTTLSKSAAGELKEKFSIEVANDKGADTFMGMSGGEKRKVRLATALALQDLVASRATQPIDLWIGDEIDDALDPAGLERLMTILERKARERGTVLVISHSDLRDWCDEVTIVRKKDGVSTVEGSLCE